MTLDVDEYPELAAEYKVRDHSPEARAYHRLNNQVSALPTVVAFKNGKVANKFGEHLTGCKSACSRLIVSWFPAGSGGQEVPRPSVVSVCTHAQAAYECACRSGPIH